jgi:hypothetical protein
MRKIQAGLVLGGTVIASVLVLGCDPILPRRTDPPPAVNDRKPDVPALVRYLNVNAQKVEAVQSNRVAIDCKAGTQQIGLDGQMVCQKPRNFRLQAKVLGSPAVDIGSNNGEFWYWISKNNPPYVFHCSYNDLAKGVRLPFPFEPSMVVTALGLGTYDEKAHYELREAQRYWELVQHTKAPDGQPIQRITVFNRMQQRPPHPQVIAHVLKDAKGNLICQARVEEVTRDSHTQAILPTKVTLEWPAQKMRMTMKMYDIRPTTVEARRATVLFQRTNLSSYDSYDLARGLDSPSGLRRASTLPQRR